MYSLSGSWRGFVDKVCLRQSAELHQTLTLSVSTCSATLEALWPVPFIGSVVSATQSKLMNASGTAEFWWMSLVSIWMWKGLKSIE